MLHSPPHARVGDYRDVLPGRRGILLVQAAAKLAGDVGHRKTQAKRMTIAARHTSAASKASVVTGLPEGFSEIAGSCNPIRINSIEFNKKVRTFHTENGCKRVLGEVSRGACQPR